MLRRTVLNCDWAEELLFEGAEAGDDPDEDLLASVLGVVRVAEEPECESVHRVLDLPHELRESLTVRPRPRYSSTWAIDKPASLVRDQVLGHVAERIVDRHLRRGPDQVPT